MKSKLLKLTAVLAFLVVLAFFAIPFVAVQIVHKQYPFVNIEKASLYRYGIRFEKVSFSKEGVSGSLDVVRVSSFTKPYDVTIEGGKILIDYNPKQSSNKTPKTNNINLYADALTVSVNYKGNSIQLNDAGLKKNNIESHYWYENALVLYKGKILNLEKGHGPLSLKDFSIKRIYTDIDLPDLPLLPERDRIVAEDVRIFPSEKKVSAKKISSTFVETVDLVIEKKDKYFIKAKKATIYHQWLADKPSTFSDILISSDDLTLFNINAGLDVAITLDVNKLNAGGYASCQGWVSALPDPKPQALKHSFQGYGGTLYFSIAINPPRLILENKCKFKCSHEPIKSLLNTKGFDYTAYNADGEKFLRHTGPTSDDWVFIDDITPELIVAVNKLEDPGFQSHQGVHVPALRNSLLANLKDGKFAKGGSTITMQLAKNLWLERDKTILRKTHEILLTTALESCFTKETIIEYYLNIVEFGPNIYGIKSAAKHYFDKKPIQLTATESFYLARVLPNPKKAIKPSEGGLKNAKRLMINMAKLGFPIDGLIDDN